MGYKRGRMPPQYFRIPKCAKTYLPQPKNCLIYGHYTRGRPFEGRGKRREEEESRDTSNQLHFNDFTHIFLRVYLTSDELFVLLSPEITQSS